MARRSIRSVSALRTSAALASLVLSVCNCTPETPTPDGGDEPAQDAGPSDAGAHDAGPSDAGMQDAGEEPVEDAGPSETPCEPATAQVGAITGAIDVAVSGSHLVVALGSEVSVYDVSSASPTLVDDVIVASQDERYGSVAIGGSRVFATSSGSLVAAAPIDGSADATVFDLSTWSDYENALDLGPAAFVPTGGLVVANDTHVFIQDRTYGALLVFDAATFAPVAFYLNNDTNRTLQGAGAMVLVDNRLVVAIERSGIGIEPLKAVRVIDVSMPASPVIIAQTTRTGGRQSGLVWDEANSRFLVSDFAAASASIRQFTLDVAGTPSETVLLYTAPDARQVRELAIVDGVVFAATPDFDPNDPQVTLLSNGSGSLEPLATVAMPAGVYGNAVAAGSNVVYVADESSGAGLQAVALETCTD